MRNIFIKFNKIIPKFNSINLSLFKLTDLYKNIINKFINKVRDIIFDIFTTFNIDLNTLFNIYKYILNQNNKLSITVTDIIHMFNNFKIIFINYFLKINDIYYVLNNTDVINEYINELKNIFKNIKTDIILKINNFIITYNVLILHIILHFNKVKINGFTLSEINNINLNNLFKIDEYIINLMDKVLYYIIDIIFILENFMDKTDIKLISQIKIIQNYIFNKPTIINLYNFLKTIIKKFN